VVQVQQLEGQVLGSGQGQVRPDKESAEAEVLAQQLAVQQLEAQQEWLARLYPEKVKVLAEGLLWAMAAVLVLLPLAIELVLVLHSLLG
jgi:hypothetical protein